LANKESKRARSKSKTIRQGGIDQRPRKQRSKKKKKFTIEFRYKASEVKLFRATNEWLRWNSYTTLEIAERTMAQLGRRYHYLDFRMKPKGKKDSE